MRTCLGSQGHFESVTVPVELVVVAIDVKPAVVVGIQRGEVT